MHCQFLFSQLYFSSVRYSFCNLHNITASTKQHVIHINRCQNKHKLSSREKSTNFTRMHYRFQTHSKLHGTPLSMQGHFSFVVTHPFSFIHSSAFLSLPGQHLILTNLTQLTSCCGDRLWIWLPCLLISASISWIENTAQHVTKNIINK